mmetsp:Transcript_6244/g.17922  ORF Transcript_6244/g.17922 Transcript_6244/m.17922 type:complete len:314 (+) Transcript_6244:1420-2361(+)
MHMRTMCRVRSGRSSSLWRCVAKMPLQCVSSSHCKKAAARPVPASTSVPFPSSSRSTRLSFVASSSTYFISSISTAKLLLPSRGLSEEKVRSMMASRYGSCADMAGACSPTVPSSATAAVDRSTVLLPAILGPVRRYMECMSTKSLCTVSVRRLAGSFQYGHMPCTLMGTGVSPSPATIWVGRHQPRRRASPTWLSSAAAMLQNMLAATNEAPSISRREARERRRRCTARPASWHASRYSCRASSMPGVAHRSFTRLPLRSRGRVMPPVTCCASFRLPSAGLPLGILIQTALFDLSCTTIALLVTGRLPSSGR